MMETETLNKLSKFTTKHNFDRVCRYLCSCSQYASDTDEMNESFKVAYSIYKSQGEYPSALMVAQKINDMELITEIMEACKDPVTLK